MIDGTTETDLMGLPIDRFLNRVLSWFQDRLRPPDYRTFLFQIEVPPPGVTPTTGKFSDEEMAATFRAARNG